MTENPREIDFLELNFTDIEASFPFTRREFLESLGGGLFVFLVLGAPVLPQERGRRGGGPRGQAADLNAFLRIAQDGSVTCFTGKIEMGQGVRTSLAQMLADELNVPFDAVEMVMGDTDRCPWDMGTFGSLTTRVFGPALRTAAAEARTILLDLASEQLGTPVDRLEARDGVVFVRDDETKTKRVTYGELTEGRTITRVLGREAVLESPSVQTIVGTSVPRTDAREKVTGEARYAGDIRLPGMLYARILRPPAHGAKLRSVDTSAAERMAGVRLYRDGDFLAVLHVTPDGAEAGLARVKAEFDVPEPKVDDTTIFDHILRASPSGEVLASGGNLEKGEKLASKIAEATYLDGYVAHAPMEPHTATASFEENRVTVWASTQTPFRARDEVAGVLGLSADRVRILTPYVGGGFGGKTRNLQVVEAARLAKAVGKPVQVAWTRSEEFFFDSFRPAAVVKIRGGLDETGKIAFWDYGVYQAGSRGAEQFYDIPNHRTRVHGSGWQGGDAVHPFATGAWRAPANNTNTFARESHIDVLAAAAGADPVGFRLAHLTDKRMRAVLEAAAERIGWKPAPTPSGRGLGVACGIDAGTVVAHIAEVAVDEKTGRVRVRRVVCAQEMGQCVNPEGAKMQMEGCITMGLGYALSEGVRFRGGDVLDRNFDTYEIPTFASVPEIDCVILDAGDAAPQGGGEPAIICMGALIANAIHDATGVRLFRLPMTPARVLEALAARKR